MVSNTDLQKWQQAINGIAAAKSELSPEELSAFQALVAFINSSNFQASKSGGYIQVIKNALPQHSKNRLLKAYLTNFVALCEKYFTAQTAVVIAPAPPPTPAPAPAPVISPPPTIQPQANVAVSPPPPPQPQVQTPIASQNVVPADLPQWQKAIQGIAAIQNDLLPNEQSAFKALVELYGSGNFQASESGSYIQALKNSTTKNRLLKAHLANFVTLCERYFKMKQETIQPPAPIINEPQVTPPTVEMPVFEVPVFEAPVEEIVQPQSQPQIEIPVVTPPQEIVQEAKISVEEPQVQPQPQPQIEVPVVIPPQEIVQEAKISVEEPQVQPQPQIEVPVVIPPQEIVQEAKISVEEPQVQPQPQVQIEVSIATPPREAAPQPKVETPIIINEPQPNNSPQLQPNEIIGNTPEKTNTSRKKINPVIIIMGIVIVLLVGYIAVKDSEWFSNLFDKTETEITETIDTLNTTDSTSIMTDEERIADSIAFVEKARTAAEEEAKKKLVEEKAKNEAENKKLLAEEKAKNEAEARKKLAEEKAKNEAEAKKKANETTTKPNAPTPDIITLQNGTDIKALVQEVGNDVIKYKKIDNPDGPNYTLKKSDVFMIKYANGRKSVFSN